MKKIKILLGFGTTTILLMTGSVVLSCGSSNPNQPKLNSVTTDMVADYVKTQTGFTPSSNLDVPTMAPSNILTNVTLNGLSGLMITISNWEANFPFGSLTFDVSISKSEFTTKNILGVTYDGYRTNTVISNNNAAATEGKLWSWNDSTNTLTIFDGVKEIKSDGNYSILWGEHVIYDIVAHINFPNTLNKIDALTFSGITSTNLHSIMFPASLTSIGIGSFNGLPVASLTFLGEVPAPVTSRPLSIGGWAFENLPITSIVGQDWQNWAKANCPNAFA